MKDDIKKIKNFLKFNINWMDVLQIIGFVVVLYFFVYGFFGFTHDRIVCDYEYTSNINEVYSFKVEGVSYSVIKYRYGVNISGSYNEQFLLDDSQVVSGCVFRLRK